MVGSLRRLVSENLNWLVAIVLVDDIGFNEKYFSFLGDLIAFDDCVVDIVALIQSVNQTYL
jgi:hypothetical protein